MIRSVLPLILLASVQSRAAGPSATDYTVYSAALDGAFSDRMSQDSGKAPRFVIRDSTESKGLVTAGLRTEFMRRQFGLFSSGYESTLDDFLSKNQTSAKLARGAFSSRGTVEIATRKDLPPAEDPEKYWQDYYRKFPRARGLIALSRPGFDSDRKYALVYFHVTCGNLCGERGYVLLRFIAGRWIVVRRIVTMMS